MELLRRRISSAAAELDPHAVWNAFVDLLANSTLAELTDIQRHPHLVFWYESEVQNGGHLQFFENRPEELIEPTLTASRVLGAEAYLPILNDALSGGDLSLGRGQKRSKHMFPQPCAASLQIWIAPFTMPSPP